MPSKPLRAIKPMFQKDKWRVLRGDLVQIMAGKDKGLTGRVISVIRDKRFPRVVVEGRNMVGGGALRTAAGVGGLRVARGLGPYGGGEGGRSRVVGGMGTGRLRGARGRALWGGSQKWRPTRHFLTKAPVAAAPPQRGAAAFLQECAARAPPPAAGPCARGQDAGS
jgi:hypothetical protein